MKTEFADRRAKSIAAKADRIADALLERIDCEQVYVRLTKNETLLPIGMTGGLEAEILPTKETIGDEICGLTIERRERLVLEDANLDDSFSNVPFVGSGDVVAYLGQPLCDEAAKPIGALCAVSSKPKKWTETDILYLQNACKEIEQLFARELLSRQIEEFSGALLDYDNVLLALAHNLNVMISVHNAVGNLLFATNTLLQHLTPASLERAVAHHDPEDTTRCDPVAENVVDIRTQAKFAPQVRLSARSGRSECWSVEVFKSSNSMQFVAWAKLDGSKT